MDTSISAIYAYAYLFSQLKAMIKYLSLYALLPSCTDTISGMSHSHSTAGISFGLIPLLFEGLELALSEVDLGPTSDEKGSPEVYW